MCLILKDDKDTGRALSRRDEQTPQHNLHHKETSHFSNNVLDLPDGECFWGESNLRQMSLFPHTHEDRQNHVIHDTQLSMLIVQHLTVQLTQSRADMHLSSSEIRAEITK